jgi:molybdopterin/thiamine biosynthesis adenylyltransferase
VPHPPALESSSRYAVQARTRALRDGGQARLRAASVAVVGVGATGGGVADALARAGVGRLVVIDRDVPELGNLHRQALYDEGDVQAGRAKAEAAALRLRRVNGEVTVEPRVADLRAATALQLLAGVDLVVDGTDTFASRLVINDACAALGLPWLYTGVVGTTVHLMTIRPGDPCLRCLVGDAPAPGSVATCETEGVLGPTVQVGAGLAAAEALKLLAGHADDVVTGLTVVDVWRREARTVAVARDPDCPTCAGRLEHLRAPDADAELLCGEGAVLLRSAPPASLAGLARTLTPHGRVTAGSALLVRFEPSDAPGTSLLIFADGRTIVRGTRDASAARGLHARWVGC